MHISHNKDQIMQSNQNIIQKEYLLRAFYDAHADDVEKLCQNCIWENTYYHPQKALELLNGVCQTDGVNVKVFALFNLHDDHEELVAFFPYNVQNNRWVLPLKCFISWWDEVIENNAPLIHKDYVDVSFYYLAYFLKEKAAILLIHQCLDAQFVTACDNDAVHIYADYNASKKTHKIYVSNSNITSLLKIRYARLVETARLKIRDILS